MRSEQEMLALIIGTAEADERIMGAYIGGSRVNPSAPRDIFQDYDIVYVVEETLTFREDKGWIDRFGERLYMQYPEDGALFPHDVQNCYGWLMQFADGNRLDLHVCTLAHLEKSLSEDKMYRVLLDKTGCMPKRDRQTDEAFFVKTISETEFQAAANEFWWCMNNVAKGLWREEPLYVMDMLNLNVRPMLLKLLEFKVGLETEFKVSVGKSAKYINRWLSRDIFDKYLATYSTTKTDEIWKSVFVMCNLFDEIAIDITHRTGYIYDKKEAENSRNYLLYVSRLGKDAVSVL